ncbi:Hyaluronan/mRNA binding family [Forsythia ovata]|uniref:Hyaluronan/mRNA binding family n=1 Tax=Forsythia ovata TaxID=205694 RepID=A0ABD1WF39_9LAMI
MATVNPFDLLGDDDTGDVSHLIAAQQQKAPVSAPASAAAKKAPAQAQPAKPAAKLPSKPLPPAQAGTKFPKMEMMASPLKDVHMVDHVGVGVSVVVVRGGFSNGDTVEGERPRRAFERRSGTGRGNEFKREGAGRGNWGMPTDEISPETEEPVNEGEKNVDTEKQLGQEDVGDANKDSSVPELEDKEEPEEKEMTLEEYEKLLEEKRKALLAHKSEERKVDLDEELESMQLLSNKKNDDEVFIKLGSDKDKRKEAAEKARKSVSINEFLKPAEGENYYRPGGRGRGRGRGRGSGSGSGSGSGRGGYTGNSMNNVQAPSIKDAGHFPTLGGK